MASYFWSESEINERMDKIMTDAMVHVWNKAAEKEVQPAHRSTSWPVSAS